MSDTPPLHWCNVINGIARPPLHPISFLCNPRAADCCAANSHSPVQIISPPYVSPLTLALMWGCQHIASGCRGHCWGETEQIKERGGGGGEMVADVNGGMKWLGDRWPRDEETLSARRPRLVLLLLNHHQVHKWASHLWPLHMFVVWARQIVHKLFNIQTWTHASCTTFMSTYKNRSFCWQCYSQFLIKRLCGFSFHQTAAND